MRPVVDNGYERQFTYVYGAVSPLDGGLDWMLAEKMNTETFSSFLAQVSEAHPNDFLVMIVDGASSFSTPTFRCWRGPFLYEVLV